MAPMSTPIKEPQSPERAYIRAKPPPTRHREPSIILRCRSPSAITDAGIQDAVDHVRHHVQTITTIDEMARMPSALTELS